MTRMKTFAAALATVGSIAGGFAGAPAAGALSCTYMMGAQVGEAAFLSDLNPANCGAGFAVTIWWAPAGSTAGVQWAPWPLGQQGFDYKGPCVAAKVGFSNGTQGALQGHC